MNNLAAEVEWEEPEQIREQALDTGGNLRVWAGGNNRDIYVFFRHQLFAQYQSNDQYSRNLIMVQLFLCHKVAQKQLSKVFGLTVQHISSLVRKYRSAGSVGIEDNIRVRVNNNRKIKGKIAKAMIKQLELNEAQRPSYGLLSKIIKKKYGMSISRQRIGSWWREQQAKKHEEEAQTEPEQQVLIALERPQEKDIDLAKAEQSPIETGTRVGEGWQPNSVAGSFMLYAMLEKSQFLKPFLKNLQRAKQTGRQCVERVMLTLFFSHALRLITRISTSNSIILQKPRSIIL